MKVGITGVSGFIGSRVAARCGAKGIEVVRDFPGIQAPVPAALNSPPSRTSAVLMRSSIWWAEPILGVWTKEKKQRIHPRAAFWEHGAPWKLSPRPANHQVCSGRMLLRWFLW